MSFWLELTIASIIVIGLLAAILKTGQANPQSTGQLSRRIEKVEVEIDGLTRRVGAIEQTLETMEENMATKGDIAHLEKLMAKESEISKKTWEAVDRLQWFFTKRGAAE